MYSVSRKLATFFFHFWRNEFINAADDSNQIITKTPAQTFKQKILQAFYIRRFKSFKPILNGQKDTKIIHLFRNGITRIPENEMLIVS